MKMWRGRRPSTEGVSDFRGRPGRKPRRRPGLAARPAIGSGGAPITAARSGRSREDPRRRRPRSRSAPARSWPQWPPPVKPATRMPALRAAVTPGTLSSITRQASGADAHARGGEQEQVGERLAAGDLAEEKTARRTAAAGRSGRGSGAAAPGRCSTRRRPAGPGPRPPSATPAHRPQLGVEQRQGLGLDRLDEARRAP